MGNTVQYSVNIAMESIMLFIMAFLFVNCLRQKERFSTTKALMYISGAMILLLVEQIAAWIMTIYDVVLIHKNIPMRIVYTLDYGLGYILASTFYYYMEAFVKDGYENFGVKYERNKKLGWIIFAWGVITTALYAIFLFDPYLYRIEDGEIVYSIPAYLLMHLEILLPEFVALHILIRHRKMVNRGEGFLFSALLIVLSLTSIIDETLDISVSTVMLSLFTFGLYLKIDLHKSIVIERQKKNLSELQTQIMLSQLQPHFLYNVFTTISGLCEMQNAVEARDVVNRFADYFRMNLDSLGKDKFISFVKELEHIKTYLWLEKIRFEDDLNIRYEIGPTDFSVPSLAIQPIVENAVKHGILPKEDTGTLTIRTYESASDYVIEVKDDGVGFDVNELPQDGHSHVGIKNVSERLKILCDGSLEIQSEKGKGTVATIHIPKQEA